MISPLSCRFCCLPSYGRATAGYVSFLWFWPFRLCEGVSTGKVRTFWHSECHSYSPCHAKLCIIIRRSLLSTWELEPRESSDEKQECLWWSKRESPRKVCLSSLLEDISKSLPVQSNKAPVESQIPSQMYILISWGRGHTQLL